MAKIFSYTNKTTGQPGIDPDAWVASLADPAYKATVIRLREEEGLRAKSDPNGNPSAEFQAMFDRYLSECNIVLTVTEE